MSHAHIVIVIIISFSPNQIIGHYNRFFRLAWCLARTRGRAHNSTIAFSSAFCCKIIKNRLQRIFKHQCKQVLFYVNTFVAFFCCCFLCVFFFVVIADRNGIGSANVLFWTTLTLTELFVCSVVLLSLVLCRENVAEERRTMHTSKIAMFGLWATGHLLGSYRITRRHQATAAQRCTVCTVCTASSSIHIAMHKFSCVNAFEIMVAVPVLSCFKFIFIGAEWLPRLFVRLLRMCLCMACFRFILLENRMQTMQQNLFGFDCVS